MGDQSNLRYIPASSVAIPIDWSRVPEASKKFLLEQYGYDLEISDFKPLPATIGDLVKWFDESKFFGYLSSDLIKVLMDISEFGLQPAPLPALSHARERLVGPRFYMTYLKQVWFLIFTPGTKEGIVGYSEDVINTKGDIVYDDAYYEKFAVDATAMAKAFDVTLQQEVSRGQGEMVHLIGKLGGWSAWTLPSSSLTAQYNEATLTFLLSDPIFRKRMDNYNRTLRSRRGS